MWYFLIMKINELKRLQMCIDCVPTCRIFYIRIQLTFRMLATWHCVGSLVQRRNHVYNTAHLLVLSKSYCTIQTVLLVRQARPDARCVRGPDHWVRFWGGRFATSLGYEVAGLPHHHLSAGLHFYVGAWYWTDWTPQNSCVSYLELQRRNTCSQAR